MGRIKRYIKSLRKAEERIWVKSLLFIWSLAAIYDLLLSQFIPEELSKKAPKAWEVAEMTGHILPFWGWLLILAIIIIVALLEQVIRAQKVLPSSANTQSSTHTYLTAQQVVHYLADESQWGYSKEASDALLQAPAEFKERASEGRITVYGSSSKTGVHESISKTHWMSHGLDLSTIHIPEAISKTVPAPYEARLYGTRISYSDLKIVAADVYHVWPRSDTSELNAVFEWDELSRDEAIKILWKLRRAGVAIRNEQISSEQQFPAWKAKFEKWRNAVLLVAEKVDENLRQRLEVLNQVRPPPTLPVINQNHALCIRIASEILLRLEERLP